MMRRLVLLVACVPVTAVAERAPDVPRDPPGVKAAQQWLDYDWRTCRSTLYPDDPEAGTDKFSATVSFRRMGKKMRGDLKVMAHELDGTPKKPTTLQLRFFACVERAWEARSFWALEPGRGTAWGLAAPYGMSSVLNGTELGREAAQAYVLDHLAQAKVACNARPPGVNVIVDVKTTGGVDGLTVTGVEASAGACIEKRLRGRLRFPTISTAAQVSVTD